MVTRNNFVPRATGAETVGGPPPTGRLDSYTQNYFLQLYFYSCTTESHTHLSSFVENAHPSLLLIFPSQIYDAEKRSTVQRHVSIIIKTTRHTNKHCEKKRASFFVLRQPQPSLVWP